LDTVMPTRLYVLVFIEHGTRRMHIRGLTTHPTGEWTVQHACNPAFDLGERFGEFRFLILDRGSNFTAFFEIGTLRCELLDRILILDQAHLRSVLAEYQEHYNTARPHQGLGQRVPDGDCDPGVTAADLGTCQIRRRPVLSGLINEYERAA
jgi:putative transposase